MPDFTGENPLPLIISIAFSNVISPNRRYYLIVKHSKTPIIFDMENFTSKPLNMPPVSINSADPTEMRTYSCAWVSDTLAIVWAGNSYVSKIYKTNWKS